MHSGRGSGAGWCRNGLLLAAVSFIAPATAQDMDTLEYDGRYSVTLREAPGGYQSARVVINNFGGSWRDTSRQAARIDKACRGKSFPVTVQRSSPSAFEFSIWGSSVSPACPDLSVTIKPAEGAKVFEGNIAGIDGSGAPGTIRLQRQ